MCFVGRKFDDCHRIREVGDGGNRKVGTESLSDRVRSERSGFADRWIGKVETESKIVDCSQKRN